MTTYIQIKIRCCARNMTLPAVILPLPSKICHKSCIQHHSTHVCQNACSGDGAKLYLLCVDKIVCASQLLLNEDLKIVLYAGVCTIGGLQSPINIPLATHFAKVAAGTLGDASALNRRGDITFAYNNQSNANVVNTGHGTMQVSNAIFTTIQLTVLFLKISASYTSLSKYYHFSIRC